MTDHTHPCKCGEEIPDGAEHACPTNRRTGDRRVKFMVVSTGDLRKPDNEPRSGIERRVDTDTSDFYEPLDSMGKTGLTNMRYIERRGKWNN